jgi:hypothetical protein
MTLLLLVESSGRLAEGRMDEPVGPRRPGASRRPPPGARTAYIRTQPARSAGAGARAAGTGRRQARAARDRRIVAPHAREAAGRRR